MVKFKADNRGSVLITAIIIISFLAMLGVALISLVWSYQSSINLKLDRLKALYLAESAIARAVAELRSGLDKDNNGLGNVSRQDFNGGEFWAAHDFQASTVTATGRYNDVSRTIEISYASI